MKRHVLPALLLLLSPASLALAQDKQPAKAQIKPQVEMNEAEKKFSEMLTGAQLVGRYTTWGKEDTPKKDTYTLDKVTKVGEETWLFVARIQYGEHDARVPLPLKVQWAGTTPVITLDDFTVPGFGKFSCRIVFHDDQYAGVWDGGDHGGHMYGNIVKQKEDEQAAPNKKGDSGQ